MYILRFCNCYISFEDTFISTFISTFYLYIGSFFTSESSLTHHPRSDRNYKQCSCRCCVLSYINNHPIAYFDALLTRLSPSRSGDVVTMECVEKLIRKDMRHPVTGVPLAESDIIQLQMGGTGFSGTNDQLSTKGARPVAQV